MNSCFTFDTLHCIDFERFWLINRGVVSVGSFCRDSMEPTRISENHQMDLSVGKLESQISISKTLPLGSLLQTVTIPLLSNTCACK